MVAAWLLALALLVPCCASAQTEAQAQESQHARELMAAGRYEAAIPIYRELVKALPGNIGLLLDLALAEHMAGHEREAIPLFERVVKVQPEKREARDLLISALLETGRFGQAAAQLREAAASSPDNPKIWYGLGTSYQGIAQAAFERLQKLEGSSPYVAALAAETEVKRRRFREALALFQQAMEKLPQVHGLHAAVADLYRQTGHADWAAEEDTREAALAAPDCKAHAAECEFAAGHDVPLTQTAAATPEALYWQAKAANELALQAFFRLGQLPESAEMHRLKAEIASGEGQQVEAVREWRAALALEPGDPELERKLAEALFMGADYRAALEQTRPLLKAQPKSAELNFIMGDSLLRLEQPDAALPYLRAALACDPQLLPAHASLGLVLARLGKGSEAIPHLEKALALDEDGSLHFQLAGAYRAAGQPEKARTMMVQYQELAKRQKETK